MRETWGRAGEVGVGFLMVARWSYVVNVRKKSEVDG